MKKELEKIIKKAVVDLYETEVDFAVDQPKVEKFGDYSSNVAMVLGKILKKNPLEIAEILKRSFRKEEAIEKIEVVAPGYLNFYLAKKYLQDKIGEINSEKENFGSSEIGKDKKIHLDFVSANPTGPVHLGNGRGGPFGDTLANVLKKAGYDAWREYYVNDYGNQIKVLGHSILKDEEAQYKGDYIDDLGKRIKTTDPFEVGQEAAKIIVAEIIKPSMEKVGINFDKYFSEKTLHESGAFEKVYKSFIEKDLIYEKDGAFWFRAEKFGDEKDRVVKKTSGEVTYFGGDIAYHQNKFARGFDKIIDIWGADHHGDMKRVLGAVEALGYGGKADIILTQFVRVMQNGEEVKMSKRKGTYICIDDLVEEVGKDAVRFFFLMYSNDTHMTFDMDLAKERSEKNPVFYVQYAHARICSILRKAQEENINFAKADLSQLVDEKELSLIRELNKFPELVEELAHSYEVHKLPYYAIKLADKLHSFYNACKVLDADKPELSSARLNLINAVRIVLAETLRLVGVSAPDKM
ncbi:MAG: arginine--tRNA ligase [Parcubacteria group bacterium]|jgi:arginyl-tRNA synthetase